jgi:hypothetical protein
MKRRDPSGVPSFTRGCLATGLPDLDGQLAHPQTTARQARAVVDPQIGQRARQRGQARKARAVVDGVRGSMERKVALSRLAAWRTIA